VNWPASTALTPAAADLATSRLVARNASMQATSSAGTVMYVHSIREAIEAIMLAGMFSRFFACEEVE